jgi:hypothetical protein
MPYMPDYIIGLYYPFKLRRIARYINYLIIFYFLYVLVNKHTTLYYFPKANDPLSAIYARLYNRVVLSF